MVGVHRLTIRSTGPDPRDAATLAALHAAGITNVTAVRVADIAFIRPDDGFGDTERAALSDLLVDPLLQRGDWTDHDIPTDEPTTADRDDGDGPVAIEVTRHLGVTDDGGEALLRACAMLGLGVGAAATGRRFELDGSLHDDDLLAVARTVANSVIERWDRGTARVELAPTGPDGVATSPLESGGAIRNDGGGSAMPAPGIETIAIRALDDAGLDELNRERGLHLDPAELVAIADHFRSLDRDPTDAELETLAQTWSEHCAHKTFRAELTDEHGHAATPLLRALRRSTERIDAPFVRSSFVGNAGIVSFTPGVSIALKAETHNHPSAIEPFGGANTGVGGVIRDVLGTGHRPIAATDVLCFGPPDLDDAALPEGALAPRRIIDGVIAGVADYGNKIGLPTVAGAVLYDPAYATNPLVFCGCIGIGDDSPLPDRPEPGDRIVVLGGRTGRDGIRGATFSSATMDATTGDVAGASVQIGAPITEKLLIDVLDTSPRPYRAITDCGAGGLSSAIGEMAEGLGAVVELDGLPTKYPGLAPWELWLSEAQERMVVAVDPDGLDALRRRCHDHGVEMTDVGAFTDDQMLCVTHGGGAVVTLDVAFLHDGRPTRSMTFVRPVPDERPIGRQVDDPAATLVALLAHRNIASRADVIHRYDHEIGGATLVRPLAGSGAGPADGVVLAEPGAEHGLAIGIGVNPWYGETDPAAMAAVCVDEAIRNVVAAGADPDRVALLDNFSFGDPRRPETLGSLVAAVDGCVTGAERFAAPFVSGKDSLNNEYLGSDGQRHAVPPTLVITAVAHVPAADQAPTTDLAEPGDVIVLVGRTDVHFGGSHLDLVNGAPAEPGRTPQGDADAPARYRALHAAIRAGLVVACHDVAEGGLVVALAEMAIGGRLGLDLDELGHDDLTTAMFSETAGRLVVAVRPSDVDAFVQHVGGDATRLGVVTDMPSVRFGPLAPVALDDLAAAFHRLGSPA